MLHGHRAQLVFRFRVVLSVAFLHSGWAIERLNDWTVGRLSAGAVESVPSEPESPNALPVACVRIRIRISVRLSPGVCVCVWLSVCLLSVANGARASVCVSVWTLCVPPCQCVCVCVCGFCVCTTIPYILYTNTSVPTLAHGLQIKY